MRKNLKTRLKLWRKRKMWSSKKRIKAFTSAVMLSLALCNAMPFSISAAESTEATTTTVTEPVTTEITTSMTTTTDLSEDIIHDYYDTKGNATLIKHEDIIYNSEEMQFIAVTTKDGDVFYILINYSADGDEDNVYFLNKVRRTYRHYIVFKIRPLDKGVSLVIKFCIK